MNNNKYKLWAAGLVMLGTVITGCAENVLDKMDENEAERNERLKKTLVVVMSLDDMFPDASVRKLAKAAGDGNVKEVDAIVARGVDVNARGTRGAVPLFWALHNYKGFKRLLELGADPNVVFGDGTEGSVLGWATRAKDERFLQEALRHRGNPNLVDNDRGESLLFAAIERGERRVDILLDAGADINARSREGDSVATAAARIANFEPVLHLLQRGINSHARNRSGQDLRKLAMHFVEIVDAKSENGKEIRKVLHWMEAEDAKQHESQ
ncbi:MAG TPA: hypothetical protein VHD32_10830 [Candidatus Didemnitutus sp.]|nr:hypothetical protein [Candidatus Didemnitutus sp.]